MLAKQGDFKGAQAEQRKALKYQPNFAPAHRRLAQALADSGNSSEASKEFRSFNGRLKNVTAKSNTRNSWKNKAKRLNAILGVKKALEINPNSKIAQEGINS